MDLLAGNLSNGGIECPILSHLLAFYLREFNERLTGSPLPFYHSTSLNHASMALQSASAWGSWTMEKWVPSTSTTVRLGAKRSLPRAWAMVSGTDST